MMDCGCLQRGMDRLERQGARPHRAERRNLINTYRYEVAYHRTMGLPAEIIDAPTPEAMAELGVEVRALIARYEPRARVEDVVCTPGEDGEIQVEVILA